MPKRTDTDRDSPSAAAWEQAPKLVPVAGAAEPELISDGGGLPFLAGKAFEPIEPIDRDDPAVAALIAQIDRGRRRAQPERLLRPRPKPPPMELTEKLAGWRELARSGNDVLFGRGRPPHLLTVSVVRGRRGRWAPAGVSNSRPLRASRDGIRASSWRLDPTSTLTPDAKELRILVTEQTMASGALAIERLLSPELYLDPDRALLRVYVRPLEGYVGRSTKHETPVIIELPEPLGERQAVDGALYEPPLA
jgi:hypothetical protein